ncbi:MAG TPA: hypothetical protein VHY76_01565 [Acetobacteraceae bacterium]|nr:hypothetical protein [Acetobacteraceae bacterium]
MPLRSICRAACAPSRAAASVRRAEAHVAGLAVPDVAEQQEPPMFVAHLQPEAAAIPEPTGLGQALDLGGGQPIETA